MIIIFAESYARAFHEAMERRLHSSEWTFAATRDVFISRSPDTSRVLICGAPQTRSDYYELAMQARRFSSVEDVVRDAPAPSTPPPSQKEQQE